MIESSYLSYNLTNQGPSPAVGDQLGAIHQASKDIAWSTLQPYCSNLLASTPSSSMSTPAGLSKYPASVVTAACSLQMTVAKAATSSSPTSSSPSTAAVSSIPTASATPSAQRTASSSSGSTVPASISSSSVSSTSTSPISATISTSSHPLSGAGLGFTVSNVTSLDSAALKYYTQITSGLTYNSQGTIMGTLKQATMTSSAPPVPADASDLSAQPSLQAQLQNAGLPSFDTVTSSVLAALNQSLAVNSTTNSTDDYEYWVSADDNSDQGLSRRSTHLAKRSFEDFLDGFDTWVCNDLVEGLCEYTEDACDIKDGVEAIVCLANNCLNQAAKPPPVQYPFDNTYSFELPSFKNGYVHKDTVSTLICNDCGMSLSNLRIQGTIVVDLQSGSLVSSTMTLSQTSVQRFNMEIRSSGPASGSWSYVMSTTSLGSVTAPGVFTIS